MAKVTTRAAETTYVLELSQAEAQYVASALGQSGPRYFEEDTVWDALNDALDEAGVDYSGHAR